MKPLRSLNTCILAAGKGKRMNSPLPKVLHPVGGQPMLGHVIQLAQDAGSERICVIIGHGKEQVLEFLKAYNVEPVMQNQQLGTGHAVQQAEELFRDVECDLLVLSGDVPLLRLETIRNLLETHTRLGSGATLLTALLEDASGYGRIVRKPDGTLDKIVEEKDCTAEQRAIREINAGIYLFDAQTLFSALGRISNNNRQGEYYLPDALNFFPDYGKTVALQLTVDSSEISGINTREQLLEVDRTFTSRHA